MERTVRSPPRVMFAGGGTGGHLFPGIAVARALARRHPGACIVFAGTGRGIEERALAREGLTFEPIRSSGLVGKSLSAIAKTVALGPATFADAARLLRRVRPDLVVGLGGYSSGPLVLLAALTGRPTMLLEQNAVPGLTNRLLAPVVRAAAVSFDDTVACFGSKAFVSGNPVREGFFAESRAGHGAKAGRPRLLVLGGSQGAHTLNAAMVGAAPALAAALPGGIDITHQTGDRDRDVVREGYRQAGVAACVQAFFEDVAGEMHAADLAVCRAGATTLAEISAAGLPAIIVPLPRAAGDHQRRNAAALTDVGAAEVVEQDDARRVLAGRVAALAGDAERRHRMSAAARRLARPDAAWRVVDRAEELMGRGGWA